MDGSSTIAFNLLGLVIGTAIGVFGFMASVKSKARAEGVAEGRLQETMNSVKETVTKMNESSEAFQTEHRLEHKELNIRVADVEKFVIEQKAKHKNKKSDIEE